FISGNYVRRTTILPWSMGVWRYDRDFLPNAVCWRSRDRISPLWRSHSARDLHRNRRESSAISRGGARGRYFHRALWRLRDGLYDDCVIVDFVDIDATGNRAGSDIGAGALLVGSSSWRNRLFGTVRPADRGNIDSCLADEIAPEVDCHPGPLDRDLWRTELDQLDRPQGVVSRPTHAVPRIRLDDRCRIRAAKNDC